MKIRNIFLSLSLVVLLSASALAQSGNDVSIKLINKDGKVIATSNLDRNGNFNFPDLPAGDYTMKVSVQDFHFMKVSAVDGDKGTNSQNSTSRKGINEAGIKKNEAVAITENSDAAKADRKNGAIVAADFKQKQSNYHIKLSNVNLSTSDFYLKFMPELTHKSKALDAASKDAAKMSIPAANPSQIQVDSWSWGTSNTLTFTTPDEAKLKEGIEVQISVKEKKNYVGHVTINR